MASNYDLLVDLHDVIYQEPKDKAVLIKRVLSPDSDRVVSFIAKEFNDSWASEAKAGLYKPNPTCFIAVKDETVIGFACYDATAKGFFGPLGVSEKARGLGIGGTLVQRSLLAMKEDGYAYAIIGGVSERTKPFYDKVCNGVMAIPNSRKVYLRLIRNIKR